MGKTYHERGSILIIILSQNFKTQTENIAVYNKKIRAISDPAQMSKK
jgi:hypothetical protein